MNLECCISVKATKYIHKYVFKGHDRGTLALGEQNNNEIQLHLDSRYISACEATWRLLRFDMHQELPTVVRLQVHLPDEQGVIFDPNDNPEDVIDRAASKSTTLEAYFKANSTNLRGARADARDCLYQEFPQHFVWVKNKRWKTRQNGKAIGRMYFAGPSAGEELLFCSFLIIDSQQVNDSFFGLFSQSSEVQLPLKISVLWMATVTPLSERPALHVAFLKMTMNGSSAWRKQQLCRPVTNSDSSLPQLSGRIGL